MVSKDGYVKILDFGLAKLSERRSGDEPSELATDGPSAHGAGAVMGTVGYMSPEQASGPAASTSARDQFSLGVDPLRDGDGQARLPAKDRPPRRSPRSSATSPSRSRRLDPRTPAPLRWIVERCLAKDPDDRYASTRTSRAI